MPPSSDIVAPVGAEHNTLYVAIEISRKSWVVGIKSPALSANITETPATFRISVGRWR